MCGNIVTWQDAWRGFNQKRRKFGDGRSNDPFAILSQPAGKVQLHAAAIVESATKQAKKNDAVETPVKVESFELHDLNGYQQNIGGKQHEASSTVKPKLSQEKSTLSSQDVSSTSARMTDDTRFEDMSSPEESSALIIENKHTTKHKTDTAAASTSSKNAWFPNNSAVTEAKNTSTPNNIEIDDSKGHEVPIVKKSPNLRIPRQLPTVSGTGKQLRVNPQTGQFKEKRNARMQDENSNDTITVDKQSTVIVNNNSTG